MKKILLSFALATGSLAVSPLAQAQQPPPKKAPEHPCAADASKLCKGLPFGTGAVMECLKEHKSELSPACKIKILEAEEKRQKEEMEREGQRPTPPPAQ